MASQNMEQIQLPTDQRSLYACRTCHVVLSQRQFFDEGCLNCGTGKISPQEIEDYATSHFGGFIGIVDSSKSWVARIIGRSHVPSAVYAAALEDEDVEAEGDDEDQYDDDDDAEEAVADTEHGATTADEVVIADEELFTQ